MVNILFIISVVLTGFIVGFTFAFKDYNTINKKEEWLKTHQELFHKNNLITRTLVSCFIGALFFMADRSTDASINLAHLLLNIALIFSAIHLVFDPALNLLRGKPFFYHSKYSNNTDRVIRKSPIVFFILEIIILLLIIWTKLIIMN